MAHRRQRNYERGVAIILSPIFKRAYEKAGRPKPITTSQSDKDNVGRFIGVSLKFPNFVDTFGIRRKGHTNYFFIASCYHPHQEEIFNQFKDTITTLLFSQVQNNATLLLGHDINANLGTRSTCATESYEDVLGPYGIEKETKRECQPSISFKPTNSKS